jgi:hypothetical protein
VPHVGPDVVEQPTHPHITALIIKPHAASVHETARVAGFAERPESQPFGGGTVVVRPRTRTAVGRVLFFGPAGYTITS